MRLETTLPQFYSTTVQSGYSKKRLSSHTSSNDEIVELVEVNPFISRLFNCMSLLLLHVPREIGPKLWMKLLLLSGAFTHVSTLDEATHVYVTYKGEIQCLPTSLDRRLGRIYFEYQCIPYMESDGVFVRMAPISFDKHDSLDLAEVATRRELYGDPSYSNHLALSPMRALTSIVREQLLLSPLLYFESFCVFMWTITKYMTYTVLIVILIIVERSVAIRQSLQTWSHLNSISMNADDQEVEVFRRNERSGPEVRQRILAKDVVPGDHIIITPNMYVPCDCVLIKGEAIADISFVTGESKAARSNAVPPGKAERMSSVASALLLCGSKVLRTRVPGGSVECRAIVVASGFHTLQGNFLLSVLYRDPSPAERRFEYWFVQAVGVLLALAAGCMLYTYFVSTSWLNLHPVEITVRVFDLLTDAVPPALPLCVSIASLVASLRLPLHISSARSGRPTHLLAGLVNKVVLDKTNTVTTTEMAVTGVLEATSMNVTARPGRGSELELGMAACNYLAIMDGKVSGDPLEVAIMESIGWELDPKDESFVMRKPASPAAQVELLSPSLEQGDENNPSSLNQWLHVDKKTPTCVQIVASFPFNPVSMRMSVVARITDTDRLWAFSKGAYEQIVAKCDPDTVPFSLSDTHERLSSLGYRILAYSCKHLPADTIPETVGREEIETRMRFSGLVLVSNQLHPSSKDVIRRLRQSNIQVYLCTGDSMGTATAVARQAGITGALDATPFNIRSSSFMYEPLLSKEPSELVLARMTPDDKAMFIESLAEKERIGAVLMAGDGPNDSHSLCAADVGVVVNSSPNPLLETAAGCMACLDPNVGLEAVVQMIATGRSAIATVLCIAQIVIAYAVIEGTCVVLCYSVGDNLTDFQYSIVDMFIILPTALLLALGLKPVEQIEETRNIPPFKVVTIGLAFQCVICAIMQFVALEVLKVQDWYLPFRPSREMTAGAHEWIHSTDDLTGLENTVLFIVCSFQCVLLIHTFVDKTVTNWCTTSIKSSLIRFWLRAIASIVILQAMAVTALQETAVGEIIMTKMDLVPLQGTFIFQLAILMSAHIVISSIWEFGIMPRLEREIVMSYTRK